MKDKNTKYIILTGVILALLGIGLYYFIPTKKEKIDEEKKEMLSQGFDDISKFVKLDLSDKEKENLKNILEQRKVRQMQMKEILDDAYKTGDLEEGWSEVENLRKKCMERILQFIDEKKEIDFKIYCDNLAQKLEANYVQK